MRLALLIGAAPKQKNKGPFVRLGPGQWRIAYANVRDSTFQMSYIQSPDSALLPIESGVIIDGNCTVKVHVNTPGTERFVSVYADSFP